MDLVPIALAAIDRSGRAVRANRLMARLLGTARGLIHGDLKDLFAPIGRGPFPGAFSGARPGPVRLKTGPGKGRLVLASLSPPAPALAYYRVMVLLDAPPAYWQATAPGGLEKENAGLRERITRLEEFRRGVFQLVKDLDRGERELEDTVERLRSTQAQLVQSSKLQALGELSAGLAHELNQPLTVVKGLVKTLLKSSEGLSEEEDAEKLELVASSAEKMERIIGHLRTFSRRAGPETDPVDLNKIIEDAFIILGEALRKNSVEVVLDLGPTPRVAGSATRLEQVVINLATNARDAMAPRGGTLTIKTSEVRLDGARLARMEVRDTGPGIPKEDLPRVFDPFFTTKAPGDGTGLGLSISYGIVTEHGGEITVASAPGEGAVFTVVLPAA